MDPTIEEFCRAKELQLGPMRRMQRYFKDVIQPKLETIDALTAENTELKATVERLTKKPAKVPA